jgi:hypothetical protein
MGKVRILLRVINPLNSKIARGGPFPHYEMFPECDAEEIYIEREWDSWRLTEDYLEIGKSIMDPTFRTLILYRSEFINSQDYEPVL